MRLKIDEVTITNITEKEGMGLINEIIKCKAYDGFTFGDEYPELKKLFKLLEGSFNSSKVGVHFLRNKEE